MFFFLNFLHLARKLLDRELKRRRLLDQTKAPIRQTLEAEITQAFSLIRSVFFETNRGSEETG